MIGTYETDDGKIQGYFDEDRHDEFDVLGRENSCHFWSWRGGLVKDNDIINGKIDYTRTDQVVEIENEIIYVECAVKRNKHWGSFRQDGVDIETRKLKYSYVGQKSCVTMSNNLSNQIANIPLKLLKLAADDCGREYQVQINPDRPIIKKSPNFIMPAHGCHRIRKWCQDPKSKIWTIEDFFRIPYEYIWRYERIENHYIIMDKPSRRISNDRRTKLVIDR